MPVIRLLAGAVLAAVLASPAGAQPALQSMPMPPSANDPPPKETRAKETRGQPKKAPRAAAAKREGGETALAVPSEARGRRGAAAETVQRPQRYVPAEFDREGGAGGSRVEPFMSQSGRPGMGMRF